MTNTTIDILAQELQIKQRRLDKYRDKIYEQQDVLKDKIKRINELKEEIKELDGKYQEADHFAGEFKAGLLNKEEEIASLKDDWKMCDVACDKKQFEIIRLKKEMSAMAEELSYSRGEHPLQKAADRKRKKPNGKSKGTSIN